MDVHPLHALARSRGVLPSGESSDCAICGYGSPYGAALPVKGITAPDILAYLTARSDTVCAACAYVLSGKPGRQPIPLRMRSLLLEPDGEIRILPQSDWWEVLVQPRHCVLSWAGSGKKHHALWAGWSTDSEWRIGTDDGTAVWRHDALLLDAVDELRQYGLAKAAILSGQYSAPALAKFGAVIAEAERVIAPYRGGLPLDVVVFSARSYDNENQNKEAAPEMLSEHEAAAAGLLAAIAWGSEKRANDGKMFWGGYYLARISRYSDRAMGEMVSRLFADCAVGASFAAPIAEQVAGMTAEDEAGILKVCRERPDLLHALALNRMKDFRVGRNNQEVLL